jgi:hypothetical protein
MKTIIISAISAILIFGTAFAREVVVSPVGTIHGIIVERRVTQLSSAGILCRTRYITTASGDGHRTTRKSVDCEE